MFGVLGIVLGPVTVALTLALFDVVRQANAREDAAENLPVPLVEPVGTALAVHPEPGDARDHLNEPAIVDPERVWTLPRAECRGILKCRSGPVRAAIHRTDCIRRISNGPDAENEE